MEGFSAEQFIVRATITSDPTVETAIEPVGSNGPNVTLAFGNGYVTSGSSWGKSPGIVTIRVPPASKAEDAVGGNTSDGYPWPTVPAVGGADRSYIAYGNDTMAHLHKVGSYTVSATSSDLVNLETAIANASFEVQARKVPVGTTTWVDADFESLLTTLQQLGVEATLTLDLYAPPSLGCAPTASWDIAVANLPTPAVTAIDTWDVAAVPASFVATEDGYLYRIGATGVPTWSAKLVGSAVTLAKLDVGASQHVLAGTSLGKLHRIDAETGSVDWTATVLVGTSTSHNLPVSAIVVDEVADEIYAAAGYDLVRLDAGGTEQAGHRYADPVVDLARDEAGLYVLTEHALHASDMALAENAVDSSTTTKGVALALADENVLVAWEDSVRAISRDDAHTVRAWPSSEVIQLGASGSATEDDVEDLVVVRADLAVWAISGADGARSWVANDVGSFHTAGASDLIGEPPTDLQTCQPIAQPAGYTTALTCGGDLGGGPYALAAGNHRTMLAFGNGGGTTILGWTNGEYDMEDSLTGTQATVLASGGWAGLPAFALGDSGGLARVYPSVGATIDSHPSDRLGQFSFPIHVPLGGFFGSNLVVATLSWELGGTPMEAKLVDWFEVVAPDGSVVDNPIYTLGLTASQRDRPVDTP